MQPSQTSRPFEGLGSPNSLLAWLETSIREIEPSSTEHGEAAVRHHDRLTKPPKSLGRLETLGGRLAAIQRRVPPQVRRAKIFVFAADHGVAAAQRVSPYPCEVTGQMVANFVRGGAAINAVAREVRAELQVVDVGVAHPVAGLEGHAYERRAVAAGTRNFAEEPAMTAEQLSEALQVGVELAARCASEGVEVAALGEMGIGNTSSAAAITACLTGRRVDEVTGPGTGLESDGVQRKIAVLERALQLHEVRGGHPLEILRRVGGLELAAICGFTLAAARRRIAVVADGFISTAAVAVAQAVAPAVGDYVFAGHRSPEPGHVHLLEHLGQTPLLDLGMRLGEGTGAGLAISLLRLSADLMQTMATFADAGVAEKEVP